MGEIERMQNRIRNLLESKSVYRLLLIRLFVMRVCVKNKKEITGKIHERI
jgi:hypothetical protein